MFNPNEGRFEPISPELAAKFAQPLNQFQNLSNGIAFNATSVFLYQGEGERPGTCYCEWMPYQIGQAKANA